MTKEFKKIVDRLAKARNSKDGSYLLVTQKGDEKTIVGMKGKCAAILDGIDETIRHIFNTVSDDEAQIIREGLKNLIVEDEKRRFQERFTRKGEN